MITEKPPRREPSKLPRRPLTGRAVVNRKRCVDQVQRLDTAALRGHGVFENAAAAGRIEFNCGPAEAGPGDFAFAVLPNGPWEAAMRLTHRVEEAPEGQTSHYLVRLTSTPCHFGGKRWWFVCPLVWDGRACNRRVRILYRPWGTRYFACRECHELTYESRQRHGMLDHGAYGRFMRIWVFEGAELQRWGFRSPKRRERYRRRLLRAQADAVRYVIHLNRRLARSGRRGRHNAGQAGAECLPSKRKPSERSSQPDPASDKRDA